MNVNKFTKMWYILLVLPLIFTTACEEDEDPVADPIASFQSSPDADDYLTVNFTNASSDAATYSWNFGDGSAASTEENPSHTYAATGDYVVVLTATNAAGVSDSKEETVSIVDPNEALKLITGETSRTWKLYREGTSMSVGPNADDPGGYWGGLTNDGTRACLYQHEFTFHLDGTYEFNDNGMFWAEYGLFNNVADCDQNTAEACIDATAANMVNACGDDISAFMSGTHAFTYEASTGDMTLTGTGAWIGIPKLATSGEVLVPQEAVSFKVSVEQFTGYDVMLVEFIYDGVYWPIRYASYSDESLEPELVTEVVVAPCDPLTVTSPSAMSITFASDAADQFVLLDTIASGSGIEFGADDPTDPAATKVGKFIRRAENQYQELQMQISPEAMDINFENLTTVSIEVYLPSSNDYTGDLNDKVIIGLGETTCPPNWWEDNLEFSTEGVAKDEWVTLTYQLDAPSFVAVADNGATPYARNDFDMVYINIGGGGHNVGAEFYVRNLSFE